MAPTLPGKPERRTEAEPMPAECPPRTCHARNIDAMGVRRHSELPNPRFPPRGSAPTEMLALTISARADRARHAHGRTMSSIMIHRMRLRKLRRLPLALIAALALA